MIQFDINGNLTPPQIFPITFILLEKYFVTNIGGKRREKLFREYTRYINDLSHTLSTDFSQWVGGSFISTKSQPNDIDVVNLINFNDEVELSIEGLLPFFLIGGSKDEYQIDGHLLAVYSQEDERYDKITIPVRKYWQEWLAKDKEGNDRGFVELITKYKND